MVSSFLSVWLVVSDTTAEKSHSLFIQSFAHSHLPYSWSLIQDKSLIKFANLNSYQRRMRENGMNLWYANPFYFLSLKTVSSQPQRAKKIQINIKEYFSHRCRYFHKVIFPAIYEKEVSFICNYDWDSLSHLTWLGVLENNVVFSCLSTSPALQLRRISFWDWRKNNGFTGKLYLWFSSAIKFSLGWLVKVFHLWHPFLLT